MTEFSGRLRERVTAERAPDTPDGAGGRTGDWSPAGSHWASLAPEGRGPGVRGENEVLRPRFRLMLRPAPGLGLDTRFRWQGRLLHVVRVETDPRFPDRLALIVEDRT